MKKWLLMLLCSATFPATAADDFAANNSLASTELTLCSSTNMRKMLFNLGDVALYAKDCAQVSAETLTDQPIKLVFNYERNFDGEDFIKSSEVLIERNINNANYSALKNELNAFNANYQAIAKGGVYEIAYSEASGLVLIKNDRQLSQSDSAELAKAYFTIWFGEDPFSDDVKENLLKR